MAKGNTNKNSNNGSNEEVETTNTPVVQETSKKEVLKFRNANSMKMEVALSTGTVVVPPKGIIEIPAEEYVLVAPTMVGTWYKVND